MLHIDDEKLKCLNRVDDLLDKKYGKLGTKTRTEFEKKAKAWYNREILNHLFVK